MNTPRSILCALALLSIASCTKPAKTVKPQILDYTARIAGPRFWYGHDTEYMYAYSIRYIPDTSFAVTIISPEAVALFGDTLFITSVDSVGGLITFNPHNKDSFSPTDFTLQYFFVKDSMQCSYRGNNRGLTTYCKFNTW
jgi:hypothetical protein